MQPQNIFVKKSPGLFSRMLCQSVICLCLAHLVTKGCWPSNEDCGWIRERGKIKGYIGGENGIGVLLEKLTQFAERTLVLFPFACYSLTKGWFSMSSFSKIEWTDSTWNPVTGCTKISDGCANCYAFRMAKRLKAMGNCCYKNGFKVTIHGDLVELPLKWKSPRLIFVNSMSDLFHEEVPEHFILRVFETMKR